MVLLQAAGDEEGGLGWSSLPLDAAKCCGCLAGEDGGADAPGQSQAAPRRHGCGIATGNCSTPFNIASHQKSITSETNRRDQNCQDQNAKIKIHRPECWDRNAGNGFDTTMRPRRSRSGVQVSYTGQLVKHRAFSWHGNGKELFFQSERRHR